MRRLSAGLKAAFGNTNVSRRVRDFEGWTDRAFTADGGAADYNHTQADGYDHTRTVKEYYDLCSELMVFHWGESLHFAPLAPGESLKDSKIRHQRRMIAKLELREGMRVADIGCGVGGPMRRFAREAGVRVLGINSNEVQLSRARSLNAEAGLDHMTDFLACSFMDMSSIADAAFDRGYAIESTCHAADKAGAFAEIYRILKPGALFWGQEMCMTDMYNPGDDRHRTIKRELVHGIALPGIATYGEVDRALETAGFEVLEATDLAVEETGRVTPWYRPLETRHGWLGSALLRVPKGRKVFYWGSRLAELLRVFPKGSAEVVKLMDRTADAYVAGGRTGIFSPLYCFLARKPFSA